MTTTAQWAARDLPGGVNAEGGPRTRADRAYVIGGTAFLFAIPVVMAAIALTRPWGWAIVIAAIVVCAAGRRLFGRIAPAQVMTAVAVDGDGVVRMLAGRSMVAAQRRMFVSGPGRWIMRGVVLGSIIVALGVIVPILCGVLLFDAAYGYVPFLVELTAAMLALALTMYNGVVRPLRARGKGYRLLDTARVMPLLGLYAKRHGDAAACRGVPADELLTTAGSASETEIAAIAEQVAAAAFLRALSGAGYSVRRRR